MTRAADDRREDGSRCVIAGETGLAHAGSIVHNQSCNFVVTHFPLAWKKNKATKQAVSHGVNTSAPLKLLLLLVLARWLWEICGFPLAREKAMLCSGTQFCFLTSVIATDQWTQSTVYTYTYYNSSKRRMHSVIYLNIRGRKPTEFMEDVSLRRLNQKR